MYPIGKKQTWATNNKSDVRDKEFDGREGDWDDRNERESGSEKRRQHRRADRIWKNYTNILHSFKRFL